MGHLERVISTFNRRHDRLSSERQRHIATLMVWINIVLALLVLSSIGYGGWQIPITGTAVVAVLVPWIAAFVLLVASSSIPASVLKGFRDLGQASPDLFHLERPTVAHLRKWLFYPGTYLNFIALAILVEYTGRLLYSPFTPVLYAMILGAQQLSRFRLNSMLYITFGFAVTAFLLWYESGRDATRVPQAPASLEFTILALSFLLPALAGHFDKGRNFYATGRIPPPRLVELVCDDSGAWRYCFYAKDGARPLDPLIEGVEGKPDITEAKRYAEERLRELCKVSGTTNYSIIWFDFNDAAGSVGQLSFAPRAPRPARSPTNHE